MADRRGGAAFASLSLAMIATLLSMGALAVVGALAAMLVVWAISIIRETLRLPDQWRRVRLRKRPGFVRS